MIGEYDEVLTESEKIIERRPDQAEPYYNKAFAQCRLGNISDALLSVNKSLQLKHNAIAWLIRAYIYLQVWHYCLYNILM